MEQEATREEFADGSAVVTYPGAAMLIVESNLSKATVVREAHSVNYNDPAPGPRPEKAEKPKH